VNANLLNTHSNYVKALIRTQQQTCAKRKPYITGMSSKTSVSKNMNDSHKDIPDVQPSIILWDTA